MWMKIVLFALFGSVFGRVARRSNVVWTDCTSPSSHVQVLNLDISPKPLKVPGNMFFTIEGYSNQTIGSSRMVIDLKKEGSWFDWPIPCIMNIGSCTYEEMCTLVDEMINDNWLGISGNIGQDIKTILINNGMNPGLCPQPPQAINIIQGPIRMPVMPRALYWFAEGTYKANVRVIDNSNNQELACMDIRVSMSEQEEEPAQNCNSWFGCW